MISREIELVCNYRKCRQPLSETAVATICQHIFCDLHGPKLNPGQHRTVCPVCNSTLDRNANDFIEVSFGYLKYSQVDLQPSDRFKSLILAGQSPDVILDISRRAISFYELQQSLRSQFLEYIATKSIEKTKAMEKEFKAILAKLKEENATYQHMKTAVSKILFSHCFSFLKNVKNCGPN